MESKIEIYQSQDGETSIDVMFEQDTSRIEAWTSSSAIIKSFGPGRQDRAPRFAVYPVEYKMTLSLLKNWAILSSRCK